MDQTPRPDESRDDHQDHQRDLDAEFAALMGDVEIPDDLSTEDLGAEQATGSEPGRQAPVEDGSVSTGSAGESGPADVRPDDVPHNTYHPLNGGDETTEDSDRSRLTDAQEAQIAAAAESLSSYVPDQPEDQAPRAVKVAVVMTPLNRADGLAGMCSLLDLDCTVVPSSSGAFAVKQFVSAHSDWDVAELLGGSDSEPAEAAELAAQLSRLSGRPARDDHRPSLHQSPAWRGGLGGAPAGLHGPGRRGRPPGSHRRRRRPRSGEVLRDPGAPGDALVRTRPAPSPAVTSPAHAARRRPGAGGS